MVGLLWYVDELVGLVPYFEYVGVGMFAKFTFELSPEQSLDVACLFQNYFHVQPTLEALKMDKAD